MQEDLIQSKITVLESMHFAADLKLGNAVAKMAKKSIVSDWLNSLYH